MAREVLRGLGFQEGELSIVILGDPEMKELNKRFTGRDSPTDVLSFPMCKQGFWEGVPCLLGDVVISLDSARSNAVERRVSLEDEINLLLIHGILHLFGFDHERDEDARIMEAEERRLWTLINQKTG